MPHSPSTEQYRQAAKEKFKAMTKDFAAFVWWRLGNSFDTMLDYFDHIDNSEAIAKTKAVVKQCETSLDSMGPTWPHTWFDDYGWWTISTLRAEVKSYLDAEAKAGCRNLRNVCWSRFTENAPYVWDRRQPGTFGDCQPAVSGGVWNQYWSGTSSDYPGPKEGDGKENGIQNMPTNGLYLIAAERLALMAAQSGQPNPAWQAAARGEFEFIYAWINDRTTPLWWKQGAAGAALVRDWVGHYADGTRTPGFQDWAWTGDQGLILGGLTAHMRMDLSPPRYQEMLDFAKELLTGARCCLVDDGGLLKYATDYEHVPSNDTADYQTGQGVFWRYVLDAWQSNADLRTYLSTDEYGSFLRTNADAALADADETNVDILSNQLAILVAASVMLA